MLCKEFHHFWLPKRGNTREEYEDAAAGNTEIGRFAIADGASESSYAGTWARILVEGSISAPTLELEPWIAALRDRWLTELGKGPFPWYSETKIAEGAFATLLGLNLEKKRRCCREFVVWDAIAVGDGCVFQVRRERLIRSFPLVSFEEFDNSPGLVCSRPVRPAFANGLERTTKNRLCKPGDVLLLMTDALAMWFLQRESEGKNPWEELKPLLKWPEKKAAFTTWNEPREGPAHLRITAFEAWIEERRLRQELRNDDVTLLAICF
ncbi:MAG: protein phosphatase 2C domain-containing protein [Planctomycetes bacterium]|nr:protein phosphatase 2C domain-containing protein [Planctomycetota bacterium]